MIKIKKEEEIKHGWKFLVEVGEDSRKTEHMVSLDKDYYEKLTNSRINPGELIKKSFKFLLERESKESILREFDLRLISQYFSEYEDEARNGFT